MIRLGAAEVEYVSAKGGDEGWSEHWEVYERLGRRRKLHGYAVSPEGAAMLVATVCVTHAQRALGAKAVREWADVLRDLAEIVRRNAPGALETGTTNGSGTTSSSEGPPGQAGGRSCA